MSGDTPTPPALRRESSAAVTAGDLFSLAEFMRALVNDSKEDLRGEIQSGHRDVMARIEIGEKTQRDFAVTHAQEHIGESAERRGWEEKLAALIRTEDLAKARREGLLGAVRFVTDNVGRNWRGILAMAAFLGVVLGQIHVSVTP